MSPSILIPLVDFAAAQFAALLAEVLPGMRTMAGEEPCHHECKTVLRERDVLAFFNSKTSKPDVQDAMRKPVVDAIHMMAHTQVDEMKLRGRPHWFNVLPTNEPGHVATTMTIPQVQALVRAIAKPVHGGIQLLLDYLGNDPHSARVPPVA